MASAEDSARRRVLILTSTYPASSADGTPSFVRDLALELGKRFEVEVLAPSVPHASAFDDADGIVVKRFRYFPRALEDVANGALLENARTVMGAIQLPFLFLAEALAIRREVRRFRPDLIHVFWMIPQGVLALVTTGTTPWLLTTLGGDLYSLNGRILVALKRRVVARAAAVTVMNNDMASRVAGLGASPSVVRVEPMGADVRAVNAVEARPPGPSSGQPTNILFVGRLVEKKGLAVLLEAVRELEVEFRLTVIGDGPLRAQSEMAAVGMAVSFLGQVSKHEYALALQACDLVVVPSVRASSGDQDGLPVAMLEAMAAGRPVVASRLPGIADVLGGAAAGAAGLLVPPGDVARLREAIARLISNPAEAAAMGQAGRREVQKFGCEAVGERYADLIAELLGGIADRRPK